jgi:hypothetical protein
MEQQTEQRIREETGHFPTSDVDICSCRKTSVGSTYQYDLLRLVLKDWWEYTMRSNLFPFT